MRFKEGDKVILARPHPSAGAYGIPGREFGQEFTVVALRAAGLRDPGRWAEYRINRVDGENQWAVFDCMLDDKGGPW